MTPWVHLAGWQKIAWALDEDLRWARAALDSDVTFCALPRARVVLAAWWPAVEALGPAALRGKFVACFADNPPAFYLTRPGFAAVADRVDLWIARTTEARDQFLALGLPVALAPYVVDPEIFRPLDRGPIRRGLGLPDAAFVVGNFHRDTEGSDLTRPKAQKGADLFLEIVRDLHRRVPATRVLLAGPRRHWLLGALESFGVPVTFAGERPGAGDDYARNILDRPALNRLYQALDACLISSRWEGGPYSVLEAALAGRPVISTPVGTARDLLPAGDLFRTVPEAVDRLEALARGGPAADLRARAQDGYTLPALRAALRPLRTAWPEGPEPAIRVVTGAVSGLSARMVRPRWTSVCPAVAEAARAAAEAPGGSTFYAADGPDFPALVAAAAGIQAAGRV
jgi:glycosyltransferase involved in cell wall biosynthesis